VLAVVENDDTPTPKPEFPLPPTTTQYLARTANMPECFKYVLLCNHNVPKRFICIYIQMCVYIYIYIYIYIYVQYLARTANMQECFKYVLLCKHNVPKIYVRI
jgi:hypothetical protein